MNGQIAGSHGGWPGRKSRQLAALALAFVLAGCAQTPDWVNPVTWVDGVFDKDADQAPSAPKTAAETPGADKTYPKLGETQAPAKTATTAEARQKLADSLVADRDNAKYTDQNLRAGDQRPTAAPPPPVPVVVTDIAADTTTTAAVAVGGSATGEIETAGDKDWFEVELEAGRTYRFDLQGAPGGHGTLSDTFLRRILDAEGNKSTGDGQHRTYNDDFQGSRESRVTFTATEAGTYYVEASGDRDETGTYRLTVTDVTPEPEVVPDVTPEVEETERQITRPPFGEAGPLSVSVRPGTL